MSIDGLLAIDQGTSATKAVLYDRELQSLAQASDPLERTFPAPGWVEQDASAILRTVHATAAKVLDGTENRPTAVGLSVQRESMMIWDSVTGAPVGPMLSWQDRRGIKARRAADARYASAEVLRTTGLMVDPMFSALKLSWLLDEYDPDRVKSRAGRLLAGTVDAWLLWSLTGHHRTEIGCASRTQLFDIHACTWSDTMLDLFGIPETMLPDVVPTSTESVVTRGPEELRGLTIRAVLGDSHAALFARTAADPAAVKVTYGTGSSVMGLLQGRPANASTLGRTIGWQLGDSPPAYAFEGNILATGSALTWTANLLGVTIEQLASLAREGHDSDGVDLVPAFAGLGAPWWDGSAEAAITGLTLGTGRATVARAAFEAVTLQIEDVLAAADHDGPRITHVHADGGPTANSWLMQLQADISERTVSVVHGSNASCRGVARAAAVDVLDLDHVVEEISQYQPRPDAGRTARIERWERAVTRARSQPDSASAQSKPIECVVR